MTPHRALPALLAILLAPLAARAQDATTADNRSLEAAGAPDGWSLGVAVIRADGVMAGEDARQFVVPTFGYEGERVFLRGISGGVHLFERGGLQLDAFLAARLDGWDADDLGRSELAARGIDRALLEDRDQGLDAGFAVVWRTGAGVFGADVRADVSGASEGYAARVEYGFPIDLGGGVLTPTAQVVYASDSLNDYYYGTLDEEEARGIARYRPGSSVTPGVGVRWLRPFAQRWIFVAGVQADRLGDEITDSPLVDEDADVQTSVFINFSRRFGD